MRDERGRIQRWSHKPGMENDEELRLFLFRRKNAASM